MSFAKRTFLVATKEDIAELVDNCLNNHFTSPKIFKSLDGADAHRKMVNVPPDIVILHSKIGKMDGFRLVESALNKKTFQNTAFVFMEPPPENEMFVDEVVTGKVQFLGWNITEEKLLKSITRALNINSDQESSQYRIRLMTPREQLIKRGDQADFVYLVKKGQLEARTHKEGNTIVLGQINPGEFVGEMAYISGESRSADVYCLDSSELIEIKVDQLDVLLYNKPAWSKALLKTLSQRIKRLNELAPANKVSESN